MAAGDITASAPVICNGPTELEAAVEALNLALATDFIIITPISGRDQQWVVFKAERAAA
jgi:hypothetical protein